MSNKFKFKSSEDFFFYINDELAMRFIGDGNTPYTYLPLTFWMFERQLTGNNCFKDHVSKSEPDVLDYVISSHSDYFYRLHNYIIPELMKLPLTSELEFNKLVTNNGLSYLPEISYSGTEISLENNHAVVRKDVFNNICESHRFTIDDICSINLAYRDCMINSNCNLILGLYDTISKDINYALSNHNIRK
jgi:hypothetical protein